MASEEEKRKPTGKDILDSLHKIITTKIDSSKPKVPLKVMIKRRRHKSRIGNKKAKITIVAPETHTHDHLDSSLRTFKKHKPI